MFSGPYRGAWKSISKLSQRSSRLAPSSASGVCCSRNALVIVSHEPSSRYVWMACTGVRSRTE